MVSSSIQNHRRRKTIRETFSQNLDIPGLPSLQVVFLLGSTTAAMASHQVELEASQHGDVLQGQIDDYMNVGPKANMGLHWLVTSQNNCSAGTLLPRWVIYITDDVFVNVLRVYSQMVPYKTRRHFIGCSLDRWNIR